MGGFKRFLPRGNLVELAVAVVIGVAFAALVTAFVKDIVTPLIAAFGGQPDFGALTFTINGSKFRYGFLNGLISFLIIAAVVYHLVVVPYTRLAERYQPTPDEPVPMQTVRTACRRSRRPASVCSYCTRNVTPAPTTPAEPPV